ncbi:MAG: ribosome small subunit-dependent GTPase A [Spirochaetales bacterium]|nr:ribosome small subunit-dependent GTPase A [Spirochaetales bacterium]
MSTELLISLGWNTHFEELYHIHHWDINSLGRICSISHGRVKLLVPGGEKDAVIAGRMYYNAKEETVQPVTGDWVRFTKNSDGPVRIEEILKRMNQFSRRSAGQDVKEQVIAANLDMLFLVMGLDRDFNTRRLQRYLTLVQTSGITPVILLNKVDLCTDMAQALGEVLDIACGFPVHVISAKYAIGIEELSPYLSRGKTIAMTGSSGCGKSTLLNALLGQEVADTGDVRETDGRGKHTTTSRSFYFLPGGALLIDNPGLRELQLWGDKESLHGVFHDIEEIARQCRFRDCRHQGEPGCAIAIAIQEGEIDQDQFTHYLKLRTELETTKEQLAEKRRKWGKMVSRFQRELKRTREKFQR